MTSTEVHDEMLDINEPHRYNESISSMKFYECTPQTQVNSLTTQLVNKSRDYTLPSKKYISFKGQIRQ